jgi:cyclohexanone monooxygenase
MPTSIEQHVEWIADCLATMRDQRQTVIEASSEAEDAWVEHVAAVSSFGLFNRANSWYLGANIPGKKRVFMPYVGGLANYRNRCDEVATKDYEGFVRSG